MPEIGFTKNSNMNKQIAIWVLLAVLLTNFGILQTLGINLAQFKIGTWTYLQVLTTVGLGWVTYGLWRNQLG